MLVAAVPVLSLTHFPSILFTLSLFWRRIMNDLLLTWWTLRSLEINPVHLLCMCLNPGENFRLTGPAIWPLSLFLLPQQQCHCMTGTPMNRPSLAWPVFGLSRLRPRHTMHELPACLPTVCMTLHWLEPANNLHTSSSMSTNIPLQRHAL